MADAAVGRRAFVLDVKREYGPLCAAVGVRPISLVPGGSEAQPARLSPRRARAARATASGDRDRARGSAAAQLEAGALREALRTVRTRSGTNRLCPRSQRSSSPRSPKWHSDLQTTPHQLAADARRAALAIQDLCEGPLRGMFDGPTTAAVREHLGAKLLVLDLHAVRDSPAVGILMRLRHGLDQCSAGTHGRAARPRATDQRRRRVMEDRSAHRAWGVVSVELQARAPVWRDEPGRAPQARRPSRRRRCGSRGAHRRRTDRRRFDPRRLSPGRGQIPLTRSLLGLSHSEAELIAMLSAGQALWRVERAFVRRPALPLPNRVADDQYRHRDETRPYEVGAAVNRARGERRYLRCRDAGTGRWRGGAGGGGVGCGEGWRGRCSGAAGPGWRRTTVRGARPAARPAIGSGRRLAFGGAVTAPVSSRVLRRAGDTRGLRRGHGRGRGAHWASRPRLSADGTAPAGHRARSCVRCAARPAPSRLTLAAIAEGCCMRRSGTRWWPSARRNRASRQASRYRRCWNGTGPAIASSIKTDLLACTLERRRALGPVLSVRSVWSRRGRIAQVGRRCGPPRAGTARSSPRGGWPPPPSWTSAASRAAIWAASRRTAARTAAVRGRRKRPRDGRSRALGIRSGHPRARRDRSPALTGSARDPRAARRRPCGLRRAASVRGTGGSAPGPRSRPPRRGCCVPTGSAACSPRRAPATRSSRTRCSAGAATLYLIGDAKASKLLRPIFLALVIGDRGPGL